MPRPRLCFRFSTTPSLFNILLPCFDLIIPHIVTSHWRKYITCNDNKEDVYLWLVPRTRGLCPRTRGLCPRTRCLYRVPVACTRVPVAFDDGDHKK
ncbi:hypothetical protein CHS0354_014286 [Potamilus streckersoni]|uniref:Uncharacterized protein n=1 Tax=Potamilus streckersoni TaxID=2493646 RepID=A0AAE0SLS0_9BIVA|nr:hypothetical protein CHS0354_014286 [Potamilus streckersoni]